MPNLKMARSKANNARKSKLTEANIHLAMKNSQLKEELAKLRLLKNCEKEQSLKRKKNTLQRRITVLKRRLSTKS